MPVLSHNDIAQVSGPLSVWKRRHGAAGPVADFVFRAVTAYQNYLVTVAELTDVDVREYIYRDARSRHGVFSMIRTIGELLLSLSDEGAVAQINHPMMQRLLRQQNANNNRKLPEEQPTILSCNPDKTKITKTNNTETHEPEISWKNRFASSMRNSHEKTNEPSSYNPDEIKPEQEFAIFTGRFQKTCHLSPLIPSTYDVATLFNIIYKIREEIREEKRREEKEKRVERSQVLDIKGLTRVLPPIRFQKYVFDKIIFAEPQSELGFLSTRPHGNFDKNHWQEPHSSLPIYVTSDKVLSGHVLRFPHIPKTPEEFFPRLSYTTLSLELALRKPVGFSSVLSSRAPDKAPTAYRECCRNVLPVYKNLMTNRKLLKLPEGAHTPHRVWQSLCGIDRKLTAKEFFAIYAIACGMLCWDNHYHTPQALDDVTPEQYCKSIMDMSSALRCKAAFSLMRDPLEALFHITKHYPAFFLPFLSPKRNMIDLITAGADPLMLLQIRRSREAMVPMASDLRDVAAALKDSCCPALLYRAILDAGAVKDAVPALLVVASDTGLLSSYIKTLLERNAYTIEFSAAVAADEVDAAIDILCLYAFDSVFTEAVASTVNRVVSNRLRSHQVTILYDFSLQDILRVVPITRYWVKFKSNNTSFTLSERP